MSDEPKQPGPLDPTADEQRELLAGLQSQLAQTARRLALQIQALQGDLDAVSARYAGVCEQLAKLT